MKLEYTAAAVTLQLILIFPYSHSKKKEEDGHWGQWGAMSPCSVTCGSGQQEMKREWIPAPGKHYDKPFTSTKVYGCFVKERPECPQDGHLTTWGSWSACTKACGGGVRKRHRECFGVLHGGKECSEPKFDDEKCNRTPCPPLPRNFDMSQCVEKMNFTCESEKMCIPMNGRCNQNVQCHDGSDEMGCVGVYGHGEIRYGLSMGRDGSSPLAFQAAVVTGSLLSVFLILTGL